MDIFNDSLIEIINLMDSLSKDSVIDFTLSNFSIIQNKFIEHLKQVKAYQINDVIKSKYFTNKILEGKIGQKK